MVRDQEGVVRMPDSQTVYLALARMSAKLREEEVWGSGQESLFALSTPEVMRRLEGNVEDDWVTMGATTVVGKRTIAMVRISVVVSMSCDGSPVFNAHRLHQISSTNTTAKTRVRQFPDLPLEPLVEVLVEVAVEGEDVVMPVVVEEAEVGLPAGRPLVLKDL